MTICQWQPPANSSMGGVCQACGHSVIAHVGCKHCPVCYMIAVSVAWVAAITGYQQSLRAQADTIRDQPWPQM
jgi:ribosomal protein L32